MGRREYECGKRKERSERGVERGEAGGVIRLHKAVKTRPRVWASSGMQ